MELFCTHDDREVQTRFLSPYSDVEYKGSEKHGDYVRYEYDYFLVVGSRFVEYYGTTHVLP